MSRIVGQWVAPGHRFEYGNRHGKRVAVLAGEWLSLDSQEYPGIETYVKSGQLKLALPPQGVRVFDETTTHGLRGVDRSYTCDGLEGLAELEARIGLLGNDRVKVSIRSRRKDPSLTDGERKYVTDVLELLDSLPTDTARRRVLEHLSEAELAVVAPEELRRQLRGAIAQVVSWFKYRTVTERPCSVPSLSSGVSPVDAAVDAAMAVLPPVVGTCVDLASETVWDAGALRLFGLDIEANPALRQLHERSTEWTWKRVGRPNGSGGGGADVAQVARLVLPVVQRHWDELTRADTRSKQDRLFDIVATESHAASSLRRTLSCEQVRDALFAGSKLRTTPDHAAEALAATMLGVSKQTGYRQRAGQKIPDTNAVDIS